MLHASTYANDTETAARGMCGKSRSIAGDNGPSGVNTVRRRKMIFISTSLLTLFWRAAVDLPLDLEEFVDAPHRLASDRRFRQFVGRHCKRRRRIEFLEFMNDAYRDCHIHVVRANLSTHKPKRDMWLARHRNVSFHYTPTHASWLN
jgi:hypothetical protein